MSVTNFIRTSTQLLYFATEHLLQCALPPACILCGYRTSADQPLCPLCQQDLPILSQTCRQCAQNLHGTMLLSLCGRCQSKPPPFDRTYAMLPYEGPVIKLITQLKFQQQLSYAKALGNLMAERVKTHWYKTQSLPDVILPVPLHRQRLRERGFNQAIEISRPLTKKLGIPVDIDGAIRTRQTAAQSGLSAAERRHNVAGAFEITRDYSQMTVAILDDVITTGHTIRAFSKAVRAAGASQIHIWCCARRS